LALCADGCQVSGQFMIIETELATQARTIRRPPASVDDMGFSTQTCMPALAQASTTTACCAFSQVTMTISSFSLTSIS
jgi:hypothetical protein